MSLIKMQKININQLLLLSFFVSITLLFIQCKENEKSINEPENETQLYLDTTKLYISNGVFLEIDGLQDNYSMDDELLFVVRLFNENSENGFPINTADGYINQTSFIRVYDEENNYCFGAAHGELLDTLLMLNQGLEWSFHWNQSDYNTYPYKEWNSDFEAFGVKIFAGKYQFRGEHYGNDSLKNQFVSKWIEIEEDGEPLNGIALRYDNVSSDSLKVEFVIRNRTSQIQKCELNSTRTMEVYIGGGDPRQSWSGPPEFKETINLNVEKSTMEFAPKSDKFIYNYHISKNDTMYSDLEGDREFYFLIELDNRTIFARTHVYF